MMSSIEDEASAVTRSRAVHGGNHSAQGTAEFTQRHSSMPAATAASGHHKSILSGDQAGQLTKVLKLEDWMRMESMEHPLPRCASSMRGLSRIRRSAHCRFR
jgi:hypothetical protein